MPGKPARSLRSRREGQLVCRNRYDMDIGYDESGDRFVRMHCERTLGHGGACHATIDGMIHQWSFDRGWSEPVPTGGHED